MKVGSQRISEEHYRFCQAYNILALNHNSVGKQMTNEFQLIEPTRIVQAITGAYSIVSALPAVIP
jgi:hypothetical protein